MRNRHGEYLDTLPVEWSRVPIRALGKVVSGSTPSRAVPTNWDGDIPWATPGELTGLPSAYLLDTRDHLTRAGLAACTSGLLPRNTLLITTRATVGAKALAGMPVATNQGFKSVVFNGEADTHFYYHLFDLMPGELTRLASGTTFLEISGNEFKEILVPRPSKVEQRRIAAVLDTIDEAIRRTEQVIAKLQQMKQGLLHDSLTRGVDENGHLRPPPDEAPHLYKDSPLGRVPRGWAIDRLVDRISLPNGQLNPRVEPYKSWILVAPDHIESGTGRLLERATAAAQDAISGKYGFAPDDVVYSKIRPYLRKAVLATFPGLCSADMYPLRPGPSMSPRYLLALVLGEDFSRFAESVSMRSGFPKINRTELAEYRTALPPRQEQDRVASILAAHDERLAIGEGELGKLRTLKRGLLHDLMTGRVRTAPKPEEQ